MAEKKQLEPGRHLTTIKRDRQNKKSYAANKGKRAEVRSKIKHTRAAIAKKDAKAAQELFLQAQVLIDRSIRRGLTNARTGQRQISRLHRSLQSLSS